MVGPSLCYGPRTGNKKRTTDKQFPLSTTVIQPISTRDAQSEFSRNDFAREIEEMAAGPQPRPQNTFTQKTNAQPPKRRTTNNQRTLSQLHYT